MKRSQGFYQKRKRLASLKYNDLEYRATVADVREWFDVLNEQIFGDKLTPIRKIKFFKFDDDIDVYAFYHYFYKCKDKKPYMSFQRMFDCEKEFVEILAHEMIHHFQFLYDEPISHGSSFMIWRDNFNLKGLELYKVA